MNNIHKIQNFFFSREASMKSEKREKKNENRKMKTPVYDGEEVFGIFYKVWENPSKVTRIVSLVFS